MNNLQDRLEKIESNVKELVRKLNKSIQTNKDLLQENKELKDILQKKETNIQSEEVSYTIKEIDSENETNPEIKSEIAACIKSIDDCLQLIK